jgi:hypothetical protein
MKRLAIALTALAGTSTLAQTPDVVVRMDINPHYRITGDGVSTFRWYDSLGQHSTVGLSMILEPGFRLFVTEKLQRMPTDNDQLDEYYIEDEGNWRVGKQYLPFGRGTLLHESTVAARVDTTLLIEGLPISLAAVDAGPRRQKGIVGRIGTRIGVSFAIGRHFGIDGTSLGLVRDPEEAPGEGRGYKNVVGLDVFKRIGVWRLQSEWLAFWGGETAADPDFEVSDVSFSYSNGLASTITLGWSRNWRSNADIFRAQAKILMIRGFWLEPLLRFRGSTFRDFGVSVRAKL